LRAVAWRDTPSKPATHLLDWHLTEVFIGGWVALGVSVLLLAFGLAHLHLPPTIETTATLVKPEMQLSEVEAVFGRPGQLVSGVTDHFSWCAIYKWAGPDGVASITISGNRHKAARVIRVTFERTSESPFGYLRSLFRL
jgi:hypothetical protein